MEDGSAWDLGGNPDGYVKFTTTGGDYRGESAVVEDTLTPQWDAVLIENISGTDLVFRGLEVEVLDEDLTSDQSFGTCIITNFEQGDLGSGAVTRECEALEGVQAGWTLTFRVDRR
jgi:hypothetical protein